jgi:opine dehydrogenase
MGFRVRLYDIIPETIQAIQEQGGIQVDGTVEGFGKLELATTDLQEALEGADMVVVVAPALAHANIAKACAPHLKDGQIIFIHPGATCGALEFRKVLDDQGCPADVVLAEANSLIYACRCPQPGHASIFGIKNQLMVAALPAKQSSHVVEMLQTALPQIYEGKNVLHTSLENPNAMLHPAPSLLNTSIIESGRDWLYYYDGITPSIGAYVEGLDTERQAIGKSLGLELTPLIPWFKIVYDAPGETVSEAVRNNKAYAGVKGQKTLRTRYVLEDIPMGLVPLASLGRALGIPMERTETIIKLGELLLNEDFSSSGRTLENLGLAGMGPKEIIHFAETGSKEL